MDQEKTGKFIASLRKEKNMTQQELADKLNVTDRAIGNWENGRRFPDISLMKELCNIFGITIDELIYGERINADKKQELLRSNAIGIYLTKKKIENLQVLTEILIVAGIFVTMTVSHFMADTTIQKIITWALGLFIWGFGLILRVGLSKIKMIYND